MFGSMIPFMIIKCTKKRISYFFSYILISLSLCFYGKRTKKLKKKRKMPNFIFYRTKVWGSPLAVSLMGWRSIKKLDLF